MFRFYKMNLAKNVKVEKQYIEAEKAPEGYGTYFEALGSVGKKK